MGPSARPARPGRDPRACAGSPGGRRGARSPTSSSDYTTRDEGRLCLGAPCVRGQLLPEPLRQVDDGDFPLAAVTLALSEGQNAAIVRPRGEREVPLQQAFGIAAIGVRDPQVALFIHICLLYT